uniref:Uncharacterized protein n=1 Tax=Chenopodium quinoa TaxID=63459 RepID=A0A803KZT0_CHEQI
MILQWLFSHQSSFPQAVCGKDYYFLLILMAYYSASPNVTDLADTSYIPHPDEVLNPNVVKLQGFGLHSVTIVHSAAIEEVNRWTDS